MSILTNLLGAKSDLLGLAVRQLELLTGKQGEDVKLIAEMLEKAHRGMRLLKLDPNDTTGLELYHALLAKVEVEDKRLAKKIGGRNPHDLDEMIPLIIKRVKSLNIPKKCWAIKDSVAIYMLSQMPPKNIMKRLGYKKVDQLLANEELYEVYGALRFAEDPIWLNKFIQQYKSLKPGDFEEREIKLVHFDAKKWGNIAEHFIEKKLHNITHLKELGVILTMPVDTKTSSMTGKGVTLKVFSLLLHYYNEVRLYSAFFKLMKTKKNFGEVIVATLVADTPKRGILSDKWIDWRVIQRYFGKLKDESHPERFEPHVHPEDLHWRKAEETLYKIDPELGFWKDLDYVGIILDDNQIITFNLMDVAFSYANGMSFKDRYLYHFRESLWNELFIRYMGKKILEEKILEQLDNDFIQPEKIEL